MAIREPYYGELKSPTNSMAWQIYRTRHNELPLLEKEIIEDDGSEVDHEMRQVSQHAWGLLEVLNKYERDVLVKRFYYEMTLQEVADSLSLTRERIRQIEVKGLRKLKSRLLCKYSTVVTCSPSLDYAKCISNIPSELIHTKEWFEKYNARRSLRPSVTVDVLEVSPLTYDLFGPPDSIIPKKPLNTLVHVYLRSSKVYKESRFSYSSFPIYVWC